VSNFNVGKIGDTVMLQAMAAQRFCLGEVSTKGYIPSGEPREVTIAGITSCFLLDVDCELWKLTPENDDDFYVVIPKPKDNSVTISHAKYTALLAESRFLSALENAGVDNWEGYSIAYSDSHDEADVEDSHNG
jgi:hypothetical protein